MVVATKQNIAAISTFSLRFYHFPVQQFTCSDTFYSCKNAVKESKLLNVDLSHTASFYVVLSFHF